MKKYTSDELLRMDAVEVYRLRLDRKIHRFPSGFWQLSEGKENAKKCVRYLLEEVLGYKSDESIKKNFGSNTLEKIVWVECYLLNFLILVLLKF